MKSLLQNGKHVGDVVEMSEDAHGGVTFKVIWKKEFASLPRNHDEGEAFSISDSYGNLQGIEITEKVGQAADKDTGVVVFLKGRLRMA